MLTAAFPSRSCLVLQWAQVQALIDSVSFEFFSPHAEHSLLDANHRSTSTTVRRCHVALYDRSRRNVPQAASAMERVLGQSLKEVLERLVLVSKRLLEAAHQHTRQPRDALFHLRGFLRNIDAGDVLSASRPSLRARVQSGVPSPPGVSEPLDQISFLRIAWVEPKLPRLSVHAWFVALGVGVHVAVSVHVVHGVIVW